jgi:hypothetical protein
MPFPFVKLSKFSIRCNSVSHRDSNRKPRENPEQLACGDMLVTAVVAQTKQYPLSVLQLSEARH